MAKRIFALSILAIMLGFMFACSGQSRVNQTDVNYSGHRDYRNRGFYTEE